MMEKGPEGKRAHTRNVHGEIFGSESKCAYAHSLLRRDLAPWHKDERAWLSDGFRAEVCWLRTANLASKVMATSRNQTLQFESDPGLDLVHGTTPTIHLESLNNY
jgi:hypothetical protein